MFEDVQVLDILQEGVLVEEGRCYRHATWFSFFLQLLLLRYPGTPVKTRERPAPQIFPDRILPRKRKMPITQLVKHRLRDAALGVTHFTTPLVYFQLG